MFIQHCIQGSIQKFTEKLVKPGKTLTITFHSTGAHEPSLVGLVENWHFCLSFV